MDDLKLRGPQLKIYETEKSILQESIKLIKSLIKFF
jgi:hypothetical protein